MSPPVPPPPPHCHAAPPAGRELLDDLAASPGLVRESLRNIARANWWFGGLAATRFGLSRLLAGAAPPRLRLLDLGAGLGDVSRAVARWLSTRGTAVDLIALERHPVAARAAREGGLATTLGDGRLLPFRDGAVDVTLVSQVAHHLTPRGVAALVREAGRVSRLGVVLADLRPSRPAAWGFRLASRVLGFDRATRADGVLSLERGFTRPALARLLADAGIDATIAIRPGARIVAYWSTRT
jgi:SAM-dependent methyltransferase